MTTKYNSKTYLEKGYCVVKAKQMEIAEKIRNQFVLELQKMVPGKPGLSPEDYLNTFHHYVKRKELNDVRVAIHKKVGASSVFKRLVLEAFREPLISIIGNEIAMQRQVNFVFHMPKDPAALIYLHTDAWSGCSPYETVLWMPLVDVYGKKSMYICDLKKSNKHMRDLREDAIRGKKIKKASDLLKRVRPDTKSLNMKFGEGLLFSPILLHGSEENTTDETRFVLNVRFKGLYTPYGTKAIGETFVAVNFMPATQLGLDYESEFGLVQP